MYGVLLHTKPKGTNLSKTTAAATQITINSSGDNVVIGEEATTITWFNGTTHHDKLDGIA